MSQVNLLPPELRQRQAVRRRTSMVIAAGLVVLALIGAYFFVLTQQLSDVEGELAAQQDVNADLTTQIGELQQFAQLEVELDTKEALVASLYVNEVAWSGALLDVSRVIPDASYLTNMTGQLAPADSAASGGTPETTLIGNMTFAGVADETETIATWLTRLEQVSGWVNAWVNSAQETEAFSRIYTFSNGVDLTQDAVTARGRGEVAP